MSYFLLVVSIFFFIKTPSCILFAIFHNIPLQTHLSKYASESPLQYQSTPLPTQTSDLSCLFLRLEKEISRRGRDQAFAPLKGYPDTRSWQGMEKKDITHTRLTHTIHRPQRQPCAWWMVCDLIRDKTFQ